MRELKHIILSKEEFSSLYRFGTIYITEGSILVAKSQVLVEQVLLEGLKRKAFSESEEAYLFLELKPETKTSSGQLNLNSISKIIPLTENAKREYELKFDPRICFSVPNFENLYNEYRLMIKIQERISGIEALKEILKIKETNLHGVSPDVIKKNLEFRLLGKKSSEIQTDFLTQLLVYDRYELFPNNDLGYLYDIGEVLVHSLGAPGIKVTNLFEYLQSRKPDWSTKKLSHILEDFEYDSEVNGFKDKLTNGYLKMYIAGVLYLKFKEEIQTKEKLTQTNIPAFCEILIAKKTWINELVCAINLLGAFFGYKQFYDDLYLVSDFKFFKTNNIESSKKMYGESIQNEEKTKDISDGHNSKLQEDSATSKEIEYISTRLSEIIVDPGVKVAGETLKQLKEVFINSNQYKYLVKKITISNIIEILESDFTELFQQSKKGYFKPRVQKNQTEKNLFS